MRPKATDLKPNRWYTAYHKDSARVLLVMYLGEDARGMTFRDRDHNLYQMSDFYFWKATE